MNLALILNSALGKALLVLPLVMLGNNIFGAVLADFKGDFSWQTMKAGIIKGMVVYAGIAVFVFVSFLAKDLAVDFQGSTYTLIDAMYVIIWATVVAYGKDGIDKLAAIFKFKVGGE